MSFQTFFFTYQLYETRLTLQITVRMEEKRPENLSEELDSSPLKENSQDTSQHAKPVRSKEQSQIQMSLQTVVAVAAGSRWLILHRQLSPQVRRHNPSPLCFQRLSPPYYNTSSHQTWTPTLSPAAAEIRLNEPRRTWSSCRQSWETWGTSSTRWRVNTSKASWRLGFWLYPLIHPRLAPWPQSVSQSVCCTNVTVLLCSSKEIKLLMNELDEEKRIRLTLQVKKLGNPDINAIISLEGTLCNWAEWPF